MQYIDKALQYVSHKKKKKEKAKPPAPSKPARRSVWVVKDGHAVPPQPKIHNPLNDLPKSFNLEVWKRAYSNLDTRGPGGALEWFYERYVDRYGVKEDQPNFSISDSTRRGSLSGV
jgi:elongation factor 1-gamma